LDSEQTGRVTGSLRHTTSDVQRSQRKSVYGSQIQQNLPKKKPKGDNVINKCGQVMSSPQYEFIVNVVGVVNIVCILIIQLETKGSAEFIIGWIYS
jgi:hypothetical protein